MKMPGRFIAVAFVTALLVPFAGEVNAQSGSSQEPIRLGVGVDPAFSPIYYAVQNKLFEEAGLNVEMLQMAQSADAMDAVIAGQNQLAGGSESTVITRAAHGDVRALAVFGESGKFIKLVGRKGIDDPTDIRKLGVVRGSASEFVSGKMLEKYGMAQDDVEWIYGAPPEFPALLARGDIDAYFLWEPWPARGLDLGGSVLLHSEDAGYSYNMIIAADGAWMDANLDAAKTIVRVLDQACAAIREDPNRAAQATHAMVRIPAEQARELLTDVDCYVRDFSDGDMATYNEIADFQFDRKSVPVRADIERVMQRGFVNDALQAQ